MLIMPAMTLDDAKAWSGQGYIAAVLIGLPAPDFPLGYIVDEEMEPLVYGSVGLKDRKLFEQLKNRAGAILTVPKAEERALIEKGCQALESTLLGLGQYVRSLQDLDLSLLDIKNQRLLKERSENMKDLFYTPELKDGIRSPILFIRFADNVGSGSELHPAPDPLALLCKAANVFSLMAGQKLLANAAAPIPSEHDDELEEVECLAETHYLDVMQSEPLHVS